MDLHSVIFTFTPPREVFARVLASVLARWPAALVDGFDEPSAGPETVAGLPSKRLSTGGYDVSFYRDAAMIRHADEAAYGPMADGDGMFGFCIRVRRAVEFRVSELDELQVADDPPRNGRAPLPYEAWVCTPVLVEVTVVTGDDPDTHPFSAWVLNEVKWACGGPSRPLPITDHYRHSGPEVSNDPPDRGRDPGRPPPGRR